MLADLIEFEHVTLHEERLELKGLLDLGSQQRFCAGIGGDGLELGAEWLQSRHFGPQHLVRERLVIVDAFGRVEWEGAPSGRAKLDITAKSLRLDDQDFQVVLDWDSVFRGGVCTEWKHGGGGSGKPDGLATRDCRHAQA